MPLFIPFAHISATCKTSTKLMLHAAALVLKRAQAELRELRRCKMVMTKEQKVKVPFATLTFDSPAAYLQAIGAVAALTSAVGKSQKGLPTAEGFLVTVNGCAFVQGANVAVSQDPDAVPGLLKIVVKPASPECAAVEAPKKKQLSDASAANQAFQSAAVRTVIAERFGVRALVKAAQVLCARRGKKPCKEDSGHLVAQVLGLLWQDTVEDLEAQALAGRAHKKDFVEQGLLKLAAVLKEDPRAVMDVPAVHEIYARVADAGPVSEQGGPKGSALSCTHKRRSAGDASGEQPSPKKVAPAETQDATGAGGGE